MDQNIRMRLAEAQNWRCAYCGVVTEPDGQGPRLVTRDHVVPRSEGGGDDRDNLIATCNACNKTRGALEATGFWRVRRRDLQSGAWPAGEWPTAEARRGLASESASIPQNSAAPPPAA